MIIRRKIKNNFDYTFLLVSLYLFLIIFFLLLTSTSKLAISESFKIKNSLEKKFNPKNYIEEPFSEINDFYRLWYIHAKSQLELFLKDYSNVEIINGKKNSFFKFALPISSFFIHNDIEISKKILLSKISDLLNERFKSDSVRLNVILASNDLEGDKIRFINLVDYISKLNNSSIYIGFRSSTKNDNKLYFTFIK